MVVMLVAFVVNLNVVSQYPPTPGLSNEQQTAEPSCTSVKQY